MAVGRSRGSVDGVGLVLWFAIGVPFACNVGGVDLRNKRCPCVSGFRCDACTGKCVPAGSVSESEPAGGPDQSEGTGGCGFTTAGSGGFGGASSEHDGGNGGASDGYPECGVRTVDHRLYCTNRSGDIYAAPTYTSEAVDALQSTYSWFSCWTTGERHEGGNTTWYETQGDIYGRWGYVPASYLNTAGSFDMDPSAEGLAACELKR